MKSGDESRRRLLMKKLRLMREDSRQFEDQIKRIQSLEETGTISKRKKQVMYYDPNAVERAKDD
jgi:hypothetical protein